MKKMVLDGKISDYMYNLNTTGNGIYPIDVNGSTNVNNFASANNCGKNQPSNNDCNVNHYCPNSKFDHLTNHWGENMMAMHQQAQQETNYFRNQWHFNGASSNSYHVNDTTIPNISATQLAQNQHCLLIPHPHFSHPPSAGKLVKL